MISEEMCTTIKTLFEKGYNISQIARMLNIDRKTVRKKLNETNKPLKEKTRVSILDPYKEYIEIEAQKGIQAKRIFHDLIRDYGYSGSYDTVKKYMHDLRQTKPKKVYMVLHSHPGEEAQVDFGYIGTLNVNGHRKKAWIFIMSLSYSRYMYVEIVLDQKVVVHPACGNKSGTLVNGLLYHSKNLSSINGEFRPGIVHRIDADTTGLLMIAKNDKAHKILADQLKEKTTHRVYYALVWGVINNETGTVDAPIGRDPKDRKKMAVTPDNSKEAITHFRVIERYKNATLIELKLETGRTHQIRVHMKYIGHPVVNDPVYSNKPLFDDSGQCLHAKELGFIHPTTNEFMKFDSELPECFIKIQNLLKNE